MVDDMYWGRCERCPTGWDYRYIPENSSICLSCMEERFDHFEYQPQSAAYDEDELEEMRGKQ